MDYYFKAGCIILLLFIIFDRKTVRVQWDSLAKFLAFMFMLTLFRISQVSFDLDQGIIPEQLIQSLGQMSVWRSFAVFWEDSVFVLSLVFLKKFKITSKWFIWYPLFAISSAFFGHGHLYQGETVALLTSLFPYFISYRYGKKVGFGTVMLGHIAYDFITIYTVKFIPYLL